MNAPAATALVLGLLLAGCTQRAAPATYTLTAVLPNPAHPGDRLTVQGSLPANAALQLDGQDVPSVPISNGVQLDLPDATSAGQHVLRVRGTDLAGATQVIPRLDAVTLQGQTLTVRGSGWLHKGNLVSDTGVLVNAQLLTPRLSGNDLVVTLGSWPLYGALSVQVTVGQSASEPFSVLRQAAAVRGTVTLPALSTPDLLGARSSPTVQPVRDATALVVRRGPQALDGLTLPGLLGRDELPGLALSRLRFSTAAQAQEAQARLVLTPGVTSVKFDAALQTDGLTGLAVPAGLGQQWFWPLEGLPRAWERVDGSGVIVAVVDTGVAPNHPDLKDNLLPGHDFVDNSQPVDTVGHGTHVAGLIAANGAVRGAAPRAKILPVRVLDAARGGSAFTVAQGLLWAAGLLPGVPNPNPAQIVNLSLGTSEDSDALRGAVAEVVAKGVLVVAATGNTGGGLSYPAAYPGVLAVTAVAGPKLTYQPTYASKGPGTGLAAYGGDSTADQDADGVQDGILSTDLVNGLPGYGLRMGTSMAAPQVSGIAALALSAGTPPSLLRQTLLNTATDLGVMGQDERFGHGLVNAEVGRLRRPHIYVLALDTQEHMLAWTSVAEDGRFVLSNLDPAVSTHLRAVSDENNNRVLGEAGELRSAITPTLTLAAGAVSTAPTLSLSPSSGQPTYPLEP